MAVIKTIELENVDVASVKWLQYSLIKDECTVKMYGTVFRVRGSVEELVGKIKQAKPCTQ